MRRPRSKRTGLGGVDYDRDSSDRLTASGGWEIVNDDSSSDGSDADNEGGSGNMFSFLFGSTASPLPGRRGRRGFPRSAGDRSSGLGLDTAGGGIGGYLPLDLTYITGLTGWSQQQQQRGNNADGWDDNDSDASRYSGTNPALAHSHTYSHHITSHPPSACVITYFTSRILT